MLGRLLNTTAGTGIRGPVRPVSLLLASNILGTAVAGVFFLTASWNLTLEQMGSYAVAISIQWVTVGLIGSGLSVAVIRRLVILNITQSLSNQIRQS